jgi:hypothetical protein
MVGYLLRVARERRPNHPLIVMEPPRSGMPRRGPLGPGPPYGRTVWFAFIGSALLVAVLWRQFDHIAHDGSR